LGDDLFHLREKLFDFLAGGNFFFHGLGHLSNFFANVFHI